MVRLGTPSFTVGAMCVVERADGALLLVRNSYRGRWGFPGGLLQRGEEASDAARRELVEELDLAVELVGEAAVVVDSRHRRVDVIHRARLGDRGRGSEVAPASPEIVAVGWFRRHALPELQPEAAHALVTATRSWSWPCWTSRRPPPTTPEERPGADGRSTPAT